VRVFVSSVIRGMELDRAAAAEAAETLRCTLLRSEDFGARPESSQVACLSAVREADAVILLLGSRYGTAQDSGLSATHEEYLEARERCQVLAFVQVTNDRDEAQHAFVSEVESWAGGVATERFHDPADLRTKVTRALHDLQLRSVAKPADPATALRRAESLVPREQAIRSAMVALILCPTVAETILRPASLEDFTFRRDLKKEALFGTPSVFEDRLGLKDQIIADALILEQPEGASLLLAPDAAMRLITPASTDTAGSRTSFPTFIEEDVREQIERGYRFLANILDRIDKTQRIRELVLVAAVGGSSFQPWRTRAEHARSPNSFSLRTTGDALVRVHLEPPNRGRAFLRQKTAQLAEDFTALLRRRMTK
jgi:hypothetical protein